MIKLSSIFWLIVVATAGFAMFALKYQVQGLADQLAATVKQADDTERDIRVLGAEWAYLNRPDALAQLNARFLTLAPIATKQLRASVADLPMRAPPPPPPPPVETIAAAGPIAPLPPAADPPAAIAAASALPAPPVTAAAQPVNPAPARPAESVHPILTAALETVAAAPPGKQAQVKPAARQTPVRRAASLNALIAQIAETRQ